MNHKNSRIITIFRAGSFLSRAQGPETEEFLSTTKKSIGSYWESTSAKKIASGLTFDEEELLLPVLIDTPKEDREFRKKVTLFYAEIDTQVPHSSGRSLEIGFLDSNEKPVGLKNMPINLMDYLRYRQIQHHPQVAATKEEADGNSLKEFYIFDKTDVIKKNAKKTDEKDASIQIYLEIKNDPIKVDSMLTLLGVDPREFSGPDEVKLKQEELRRRSELDPADFSKIYNESDLEIRYWIKTLLNTNVFSQIGMKILDGETKKIVGNTMEEVVYFFKDEENSEAISMYKTRMQEALKKPIVRKR